MTTPVASWARSVITGLRWTGRGILLGLGEVWWWIGGGLRFLRPGTRLVRSPGRQARSTATSIRPGFS